MNREPLDLRMTVKEVIVTMCEGNPGALNVLCSCVEKQGDMAVVTFGHLDDLDIRGDEIWVGYSDYCNKDLDRFIECVCHREQGFIDVVNTYKAAIKR